ncbi:thiol:disulfide interchange protein DsbA/DsbL [Shewanella corallii]|uniref:Thiol:disulfide interchange protein n=1 Tax=Shewanella corallii TaxID=560080 RepID=A0ABT0N9N5_9GAMM|nr:thiol:disulfide interchange protein DsbA/DsbL [Shewanella corallii]MCL2915119.1 thiol:disulfide interchange protein DsbA/DsbL [Shewanella corallii]
MRILIALCFAALAFNTVSAEFQEGTHYRTIHAGPASEEHQLTEFFSYFCGHCYRYYSQQLPELKKSLPKEVEFKPSHVGGLGGAMGQELSRAFAIAELLGKQAEVDEQLFSAIHRDKKRLSSRQDIKQLMVKAGIPANKFDSLVDSFMVNTKVAQMNKDTEKAEIRGVPAFVVNDKYLINTSVVSDPDTVVSLINYLNQKS